MAYSKIVYRSMVDEGPPTTYPQTADQAALAIGINLVTGFRVERVETRDEHGQPLVIVSVYGSNEQTEEILFGTYEFYGSM